ncbi:TetR/AcrR family transcriptional regulator [Streptomyces sp. NPDC001443]
MPRPPGHGPDYEVRRQKIIDIAAQLFARQGYAATSVNDVGRAAGLAKGALYYYIGSKESLLVEIQSRVMVPLMGRAREISELDTPALLRLRLLSESLLTIIFHRLDHIWVYEHDYRSLSGLQLEMLLEQRAEFERLVSDLLSEASEQGSLQPVQSRLATLQFLNLHHHTYQWVRTDGPWDPAFLSGEYCETLFRGLGADESTLREVEEEARSFKSAHPGLPLDPEAEWKASPAED